MNFPKLKRATLCQILLYIPAFSVFAAILLNAFFAELYGDVIAVLLFIGGIVLSLWYLFGFAGALLMSDFVFSHLRYWKKARSVYFTERNGIDLQTVQKKIVRRVKGKKLEPIADMLQPIAFTYKRRRPLTTTYFAVEKITLVYCVDVLTEDLLLQITASAKRNASKARVPKSEISTFLMEKNQKEAPIGCGVAVVILAQHAAFEIAQRNVKAVSGDFGCLVPCIAVLDRGAYYFDAMREVYMLGMSEKPEKNIAIDMIERVVFSGKPPLKNNEHYLPFELKDVSPEMTLWELLRLYKGTMREIKEEENAIAKQLSHGEVLWQENDVYCKLHKRMACFSAERQENSVRIFMDGMWSHPKVSHISKADQKELHARIEAYFVAKGYHPEFVYVTE